MFLNCTTCFGRHTAHHQQLKNCNFSLWFYIRFWLLVAAMAEPSQRPATTNVCKTRGCNYSLELLMMGGVSPATCWAITKHWNNKFYPKVASCWFFLWDLLYDCKKKLCLCERQFCVLCCTDEKLLPAFKIYSCSGKSNLRIPTVSCYKKVAILIMF